MKIISVTAALAVSLFLGACASEGSMADKAEFKSAQYKALADKWKAGEDLIETGQSNIKKGRKRINEGEALENKGKRQVRKGKRLQAEAESGFKRPEMQ